MNVPEVLAQGFAQDDGVLELRPQVLINYILDESTMRVKASFDSLTLKRQVLLGPGGRISVNGVRLTLGGAEPTGVYWGHVPLGDGQLNFELVRSATVQSSFSVRLPTYRFVEYPKTFRYPENLTFRLATPVVFPVRKAVEDDFWMRIRSNQSVIFSFDQGAPLTTESSVVVLRPIRTPFVPSSLPKVTAYFSRNQRLALSDLAVEYRAGWIVMTVAHEFLIDVL